MSSRSKFLFRLEILFLIILLSLLISPSLSEKCRPSDKNALLKIKKALNDPYDLTSWKPDTDCCDWYGITCDERTHRVTMLALNMINLNLLPIPIDGLVELRYLESLSFQHANLSGPIPEALAKLTNLNLLDLTSNQLTGPVPSFLSQLKNLESIDLSSNKLTGSIPPSLSQLQKLNGIFLDRNQLTGTIPESFGELKAENIDLYLSHNRLSGKIPANLGNASLFDVDLSGNQLEGDISFMFGRNKTMRAINLSRNMLQFDFSNFIFPENLVTLDLNHNKIFGSLPQDLVNAAYLGVFNVSYNRLCGKIPVGGRLQEYDTTVYFHNRCLCGAPLPDCKKNP